MLGNRHRREKDSTLQLLFLSWESPWPTYSGAALRTWGLLCELSKEFNIEMLVMTRQPLSDEQVTKLSTVAQTLTRIPLRDVSLLDKIHAVFFMAVRTLPYHSSILLLSLRDYPHIRRNIESFQGIVFTGNGHWGILVNARHATNWILNQCDADVTFWRVYATNVTHPLIKVAAFMNLLLARFLFPQIYQRVGRIVSVCEEDKRLTQHLAPDACIDVIENGIDCTYYAPNREIVFEHPPRLLMTGTSVRRNVAALQWFVKQVLPLVSKEVHGVELLVAGDFDQKIQYIFKGVSNIRFTGLVDDIRPYFNESDVYVAPFLETHGSKLKIAQAMAMAMAIVSTPEGMRGFSLIDGESVLIANNPQMFAKKTIELLRDASLRKRLGKAARQIALETLNWTVLGKRLRSIVNDQRAKLASS